jgi:hypothetical protein
MYIINVVTSWCINVVDDLISNKHARIIFILLVQKYISKEIKINMLVIKLVKSIYKGKCKRCKIKSLTYMKNLNYISNYFSSKLVFSTYIYQYIDSKLYPFIVF